jgi:hypothetical protein
VGLIMNEEFIIKKLLKSKIKGVENYKHNGSTWLIFTSEKKWVIELTKEGTLWYNHFFFKEIFDFVGLDVLENQHYITKWVEDNVISGVKETIYRQMGVVFAVEDTIQNGVKHTEKSLQIDGSCVVEDVIKEGVKHTEYGDWLDGDKRFDDIIDNGIKETTPGGYLGSIEMKGKIVHQLESPKQNNEVEDVIRQGVKKTNWRKVDNHPTFTDNVIERGEKC